MTAETLTDLLALREATWRAMGATVDSLDIWRYRDEALRDRRNRICLAVPDLPAVESDPHCLGHLVEWLEAQPVSWVVRSGGGDRNWGASCHIWMHGEGSAVSDADGDLYRSGARTGEAVSRAVVAYAAAKEKQP